MKYALAASYSFGNLMSNAKNRSSELGFLKCEWNNIRQSSGWGPANKKKAHERIECFVQGWPQSCKPLDQYGFFVSSIITSEEMQDWNILNCWNVERLWFYWLIYFLHSDCMSSERDWGPVNHCSVRFRLSSPFDNRRWVVLFPPPLRVSSFVKPNRYIRVLVALL